MHSFNQCLYSMLSSSSALDSRNSLGKKSYFYLKDSNV